MCTVSFYKDREKVVITSNRDENIHRAHALPPKKIKWEDSELYYPIDSQSGGSWFVLNKNGNTFVLLNGEEKKHIPNPPYRKSRGLVLLEIADSENFLDQWNEINLEGIENFTIVVYGNGNLAQFSWNGSAKSDKILDENEPHIWSSSTLYDDTTKEKRKKWFHQFLKDKKEDITNDDLINFHTATEKEDAENGLVINRANKMLTKNVTQVTLYNGHFTMQHLDLLKQEKTVIEDELV